MKRKNFKRIKGGLGTDWLKRFHDGEGNVGAGNLMLEAMTNPDLLSDEQTMYAERDFDAENDRRKFIVYFRFSLRYLTPRQKQILEAVKDKTQEEAANLLGIKRSTLSMHLQIIQKKLFKRIGKMREKEQSIQEADK